MVRAIDSTHPSTCPRCNRDISTQEFYGICPQCRAGLIEQFSGRAREVDTVEYEPKMNVTPNAVASKD